MTDESTMLEPTAEVVDRLLKWPKELRLNLAELLVDSVQDDIAVPKLSSSDRELILTRVEAFERGEITAFDWRESLARVEAKFRNANT